MSQAGHPSVMRRKRIVIAAILLIISTSLWTLHLVPMADVVSPVPGALAGVLVDCTGLELPTGLYEVNTTLDWEREIATIEFYGSTDIVVSVPYSEPTCLQHPIVGSVIQHDLEDSREDQRHRCAALAAQVASGSVVIRGEVLDIDKVMAYMEAWC